MDSELSVGWYLRQAKEHRTDARATSDAAVLAWAKAFIEIAAELDSGRRVVETRDAFIAPGAKS